MFVAPASSQRLVSGTSVRSSIGCIDCLYAHLFIRMFPAAARFGEHVATLAARLRDRDGLKARSPARLF